jgi:hypothetical protein
MVSSGNQIIVTLKSTLNPLNGKVQTTATYSIDCFVDESTSGVKVLQTVPKEKIIETAIDVINQAILTTTPQKTNRVVTSVINSIIGKANTIKEKTERLKSYVSPINTSARRYSHLNKVLRIVHSILKKIKTDIDIKIPGLGVKVKSDKIGTTDVNVERIYDQVKVGTTSPNVTVETNQGQVDTKIKYQKVIIRIGDE